jgi:hypothetical protein
MLELGLAVDDDDVGADPSLLKYRATRWRRAMLCTL